MDTREFKALELAARAKIERRNTYWYVPSANHAGGYRVDYLANTCTCDDFELRGPEPCKHILAVRIVREREWDEKTGTAPVTETDEPQTPPKRKTYRQDWPAYNAAQVREKELFQVLLADICATVPDREAKKTGRPRIRERDAIFSAAFKVYSGFSSRRFSTDLRTAEEGGHVGKAPHYNSVLRVLEDATVTPVLHQLIERSSLPLKAVELDFAIDSSGFSTSKFSRWFDAKYGVERTRAEWVKTHICVGVKTNVVTAVAISDRHDGQEFPGLLAKTAANFALRDVSADKAYLSRDNLELVEKAGATPLIPFKINCRPDKSGETWERLYHFFHLHRDEFLPRYHKRSNVESAFSSIKRVMGDSVRSRTPVAMENEVLFKVLCHNLVCVIHEMHELGIVPDFGGTKTEPEGEPRIIRFPGA